jgi:hypothetical protein
MHRVSDGFKGFWIPGSPVVLASFFSCAIQAADQGSKAIVLRQGKFPFPSGDRH